MLTLILSVSAFVLLLLFVLIFIFKRMDCDFQLLFAEKFGTPISDLKGRVIWITGASSGIGESLAYVLAAAGCKLVISGRDETRLDEVKRQCIVYGQMKDDDVLVIAFDISDFNDHQKHFDKVISHFSKIDILVNNAGRSQRALFQDIDIKVDKEMFDVNVFGGINLTRIALRYFLENGRNGHFVVTTSCAGKVGVPNSATYTASKHTLHGYYECLRMETYTKGIRVTMVCPGPVFSRIAERAYTGEPGKVHVGQHTEDFNRQPTSRCAHLMAVAIANVLDECWISIQPVLTLYYITQYFPTLSRRYLPRILTPERAAQMREGHAH